MQYRSHRAGSFVKQRYSAYSRPNRNGRRFSYGAKLDSNLFIRKAVESQSEDYVSTLEFANLSVLDTIKENILARGYDSPTQIQEQTIPLLLENKDVIGIANTGTGKTAAFLIPLINKVANNRSERVLIVAPTRELAMQIVEEFNLFARGLNMHAALCIGGSALYTQEMKLRNNPHFVIGTPGRLKDFVNRGKLNLGYFHTIVLDEVDRMVDIGFIKDIKFLISLLPRDRHSVFFSATVSGKVQEILSDFVNDPITVSVKRQDTAENIEQDVIRITDRSQKLEKLHDLLITKGFDKVLIFGETKWKVENLTQSLIDRGFKAASIHGNKSQGQRQKALRQFKENQLQVLLATDVASRGLDIDDVTHVINYDAPQSYDDYIHRIGRTGRASKRGTALTFVE